MILFYQTTYLHNHNFYILSRQTKNAQISYVYQTCVSGHAMSLVKDLDLHIFNGIVNTDYPNSDDIEKMLQQKGTLCHGNHAIATKSILTFTHHLLKMHELL